MNHSGVFAFFHQGEKKFGFKLCETVPALPFFLISVTEPKELAVSIPNYQLYCLDCLTITRALSQDLCRKRHLSCTRNMQKPEWPPMLRSLFSPNIQLCPALLLPATWSILPSPAASETLAFQRANAPHHRLMQYFIS